MERPIEFITLSIVAFGLALTLRLLLLGKNSSLFLGFYVLLLVGISTEVFLKGSWLLQIIGATYWLAGPVLYFFTKARMTKDVISKQKFILHLVPFGIYVLLASIGGSGKESDSGVTDFILFELLFIHILVYVALALSYFRKVRGNHRGTLDIIPRMNNSFVFVLLVGSMALFGLPFIFINLNLFNVATAYHSQFGTMVQSFLILFVIAIALLNTEQIAKGQYEEVK